MNKMELIAAVAEETELARGKATEVVEAVFAVIESALKRREEVRIVGFGSFAVALRKASTGRHPRTGEEIRLPDSASVRFRPGKNLKDGLSP